MHSDKILHNFYCNMQWTAKSLNTLMLSCSVFQETTACSPLQRWHFNWNPNTILQCCSTGISAGNQILYYSKGISTGNHCMLSIAEMVYISTENQILYCSIPVQETKYSAEVLQWRYFHRKPLHVLYCRDGPAVEMTPLHQKHRLQNSKQLHLSSAWKVFNETE